MTDSRRASPFQRLEQIATKLGLKVDRCSGRDVTFDGELILLGDVETDREREERLAHELGHFLVAPKSRRYKENYGHDDEWLSQRTLEKEELAAAVLGMVLQLVVGSRINMGERAYLWNYFEDADSWHEFGFWVGTGILVKQGWLVDSFELNKQKLEEFYKWTTSSCSRTKTERS